MCEYISYTWFLRVIGGNEGNGMEERRRKDGVDVGIRGKGMVETNGEGTELKLQMGDEANACVPV